MSKKRPNNIVFPHEKFETLIRCLCERDNISIDLLCLNIEISRQGMYGWFQGKNTPNMNYIFKLVDFFNIDPSEFFTYSILDKLTEASNAVILNEISILEIKKGKIQKKIDSLRLKIKP